MRTVIMCAGQGKRWVAPYPKMLAPFGGRPNIKRTVDMLQELGVTDITITTPPEIGFVLPGINCIVGRNEREIYRFTNAFPINEPTLFLYGDVYYHKDDLATIVNYQSEKNCYFGWTRNDRTGKGWREMFAVKAFDFVEFRDAIGRVMHYFESGVLTREIGWEVWEFDNVKEFVTLSEYTDDFDDFEQYQKILQKIAL